VGVELIASDIGLLALGYYSIGEVGIKCLLYSQWQGNMCLFTGVVVGP
jgi:hypothetical protein